jgi:peptidoglycan/LPS O-acetylase OafA/YrhL
LVAFLSAGAVLDHCVTLPWYLHQFAHYYPNFLAGIFAFLAYPRLKRFGFLVPLVVGLALLYLFTLVLGFNGWVSMIVGLFFVLIAFVNIGSNPDSLFERGGILLGDASYSVYLIHPLVFALVYGHLQPPLPPIWSQEFLRFGSIAVVCCLAIASWKLLESRMISIGNWIVSPQQKPAAYGTS